MNALIGSLLRELLKNLDPEVVKELIDGLLDRLEDKIAASETPWDDTIVQPLIDTIRRLANIDDKKYGNDKQ